MFNDYVMETILDRGGGNRGRYGNFGEDNNRDDGYSGGGRQNYGHQNRDNQYGNREDRPYNNYGNRGGNRGGGGGGGGGGGSGGYEQERRTSESMSSLSLEGEWLWLFGYLGQTFISFLLLLFLERDAGRPKLNLAPRTVKDPVNALAATKQAAAIFGDAKPREEKIKEEETVEKVES